MTSRDLAIVLAATIAAGLLAAAAVAVGPLFSIVPFIGFLILLVPAWRAAYGTTNRDQGAATRH